ncbi:MAG: hypothetical protein WC322_03040 [Candidatus Paceibacterota bacterium]|jgi:hypothetical protein
MSPEETVLDALKWAKANGVRIIRGPVFDFCDYSDYPSVTLIKGLPACGAIGAVLLKAGLHGLCYPDFSPTWEKKLLELLNTDRTWVWRFDHGWNRGNCLNFEVTKKGETKPTTVYDEVSRLGNKLAKEWISPPLVLVGRASSSVRLVSFEECSSTQ